jgi:hypothetical protein
MRSPLRAIAGYARATRPWSLRYIWEKTTQQSVPFGLRLAFGKGGDAIPAGDMHKRLVDHLTTTPLCSQLPFRGEAMAPAITSAPRFAHRDDDAADDDGGAVHAAPSSSSPSSAAPATPATNMLLLRALRYPELAPPEYELAGLEAWFFPRRAHVGDVVAFEHPDPPKPPKASDPSADPSAAADHHHHRRRDASESPPVLVRRVAALAGAVLESDDEGVEDYHIPEGHAWVLADNDDAFRDPSGSFTPADSRAFGPVPVEKMLGRVVYCVRSRTDHGPVRNSPEAEAVDAPVLVNELDVQALAADLEALFGEPAKEKAGAEGGGEGESGEASEKELDGDPEDARGDDAEDPEAARAGKKSGSA